MVLTVNYQLYLRKLSRNLILQFILVSINAPAGSKL